jgi:putative flippase GtrA
MFKTVKKFFLFCIHLVKTLYIRFSKFFIVGLSGTVVDLGVVWFLNAVFYNPAQQYLSNYIFIFIAYEASVITNYLLSYFWVWRDRQGEIFFKFLKYNVSTACAFALRLVIFNIGVAVLHINPKDHFLLYYFVYMAAAGAAMIFNFLLIEFKVFVQKKIQKTYPMEKGLGVYENS